MQIELTKSEPQQIVIEKWNGRNFTRRLNVSCGVHFRLFHRPPSGCGVCALFRYFPQHLTALHRVPPPRSSPDWRLPAAAVHIGCCSPWNGGEDDDNTCIPLYSLLAVTNSIQALHFSILNIFSAFHSISFSLLFFLGNININLFLIHFYNNYYNLCEYIRSYN